MSLFLTERDVQKLLTMSMALEAVEHVMAEYSRGEAINMPRERIRAKNTTQHLLQGYVPSHRALGFKVYSVSNDRVRFLVHLYDAEEGHLEGILEAQHLGIMRTGAASGVATKHLSRSDAKILGVFGSGRQSAGQIEAFCKVRPINEVKVYSRNKENLDIFCKTMSKNLGISVRAAVSAEETVRHSDIIITITNAEMPLFDGGWLKLGAHINSAGSNILTRRELDTLTLNRCSLITVDSLDVAKKECGDLLPLIERGQLNWGQVSELGDVITGRSATRTSEDQITCFKSHGMAVQDIIVAAKLIALARKSGLGIELPLGV